MFVGMPIRERAYRIMPDIFHVAMENPGLSTLPQSTLVHVAVYERE